MYNFLVGLSSNRTVHDHFIISLAVLDPKDSYPDQFYSCCNVLCRHVCVKMLSSHDCLLSLCFQLYVNICAPTCALHATCLSLSHDTLIVLDAMLKLFNSCYLISFVHLIYHLRLKYEYFLEHVF